MASHMMKKYQLAVICFTNIISTSLIFAAIFSNSWKITSQNGKNVICFGLRQSCKISEDHKCNSYDSDLPTRRKFAISEAFLVTSLLPLYAIFIHMTIAAVITRNFESFRILFYVLFQGLSCALQVTSLSVFSKQAENVGDSYGFSFYFIITTIIVTVASIATVIALSIRNEIQQFNKPVRVHPKPDQDL